MAFKFVAVFAVLSVAAAYRPSYQTHHHFEKQHSSYPHLGAGAAEYKHIAEHEAPVHYEFSYSSSNGPQTKNHLQSHHESAVKGHYDMIDSDGIKHIVEYTPDNKNGFETVLHHEHADTMQPISHHGQYHYADYAPHSLQHHYMSLPSHEAAPAPKPIQITVPKLNIVAAPRPMETKYPEWKHETEAYSQHKTIVEAPLEHYESAAKSHQHNAETHTSFHGVNAKYEY